MPGHAQPPPSVFYRPELDGLRFLAFLFVFVTHAFSDDAMVYISRGVSWTPAHVLSHVVHAGRYGVPLFFVLSSYLITELLIREHEQTGTIDIPRFYLRRALRIWPLYVVFVLAVSALRRTAIGPAAFPLDYLLALLLFAGNWAMLRRGGAPPGDALTGPLWSVSVEEQFYLAWPLLLRGVGVRHTRRLALALVAIALVFRLAMDLAGARDTTVWYSSFTWLDAIGAGALLAVALRRRRGPLHAARTGAAARRRAVFVVGGGRDRPRGAVVQRGLSTDRGGQCRRVPERCRKHRLRASGAGLPGQAVVRVVRAAPGRPGAGVARVSAVHGSHGAGGSRVDRDDGGGRVCVARSAVLETQARFAYIESRPV